MELQAVQEQLHARQAEVALLSWGMGDQRTGKSSSKKLNLSMRASDFDMKEFLAQRGRFASMGGVMKRLSQFSPTGNSQLHGLHRAAAQGDRTAIMSIMKVRGQKAIV